MRLAERASTIGVLAVTTGAALVLLGLSSGSTEVREAPVYGCTIPEVQPIPEAKPDSCPPAVRAQLHVDDSATTVCLRTERRYFAFAYYFTTEWWELVREIAADGSRLLAPIVDRPSNGAWADGDQ